MFRTNRLPLDRRLSQIIRYACGILLLTSVHHAYGAYAYATPWRLHIIPLALASGLVIAVAAGVYRRRPAHRARRVALWMLGALALAFPFAMIGLFEGGYNHVLKNVLYFGGATRDLLQALFPAPTYELPNNLLFELSGIAQFPPAVAGIGHLIAMVRGLPERQGPTLVAPIV